MCVNGMVETGEVSPEKISRACSYGCPPTTQTLERIFRHQSPLAVGVNNRPAEGKPALTAVCVERGPAVHDLLAEAKVVDGCSGPPIFAGRIPARKTSLMVRLCCLPLLQRHVPVGGCPCPASLLTHPFLCPEAGPVASTRPASEQGTPVSQERHSLSGEPTFARSSEGGGLTLRNH